VGTFKGGLEHLSDGLSGSDGQARVRSRSGLLLDGEGGEVGGWGN